MISFGWKNKARAAIRKKIITVFLDNYINMKNGTEVDEWGNNWKEKSFNETIAFFRDYEQNFKIKAKYQFIPLKITSLDLDNISIYDTYRVLYDINFEGNPSSSELDELESEYKAEAALRGLA